MSPGYINLLVPTSVSPAVLCLAGYLFHILLSGCQFLEYTKLFSALELLCLSFHQPVHSVPSKFLLILQEALP